MTEADVQATFLQLLQASPKSRLWGICLVVSDAPIFRFQFLHCVGPDRCPDLFLRTFLPGDRSAKKDQDTDRDPRSEGIET